MSHQPHPSPADTSRKIAQTLARIAEGGSDELYFDPATGELQVGLPGRRQDPDAVPATRMGREGFFGAGILRTEPRMTLAYLPNPRGIPREVTIPGFALVPCGMLLGTVLGLRYGLESPVTNALEGTLAGGVVASTLIGRVRLRWEGDGEVEMCLTGWLDLFPIAATHGVSR